MTEIKSETAGTIRIADEVLATIAGTAALEADGVAGLIGNLAADMKNKRKHVARGITVSVNGDRVTLGLAVAIKMGKKMQEVARDVQQRVKSAVETMTGLNVVQINVRVGALANEKTRPV